MSTLTVPIYVKEGAEAGMGVITLGNAELYWATDTFNLWAGTASSGNKLIGGTGGFPRRWSCPHDEATPLVGGGLAYSRTADDWYMQEAYQDPPANGNKFTHNAFLKAGTYSFHAMGTEDDDRGKIDWVLDGSTIASAQDWYAASLDQVIKVTAPVTIATDGDHVLVGICVGKHMSSSDYKLSFAKYWFAPWTAVGVGGMTFGALVIAGSGTFVAPVYHGTGAMTLGSLVIAGGGSTAAPVYTGTGAMTLSAVAISGTGVLYHVGHGAMTLGSIVIAGAGVMTPHICAITGNATASGTWSGLDQLYDSDGNYATCVISSGGSSPVVTTDTFGFSLPGAATIIGMTVEIKAFVTATYVLQDHFADTNSTALTSHDMDIGPGWSAVNGTWYIQSNRASLNSSGAGVYSTVSESGQANVTVSATLTTPASIGTHKVQAGLIARYASGTGGILSLIRTDTNLIEVYQFDGSFGLSQLGSSVSTGGSFASSTTYTLSLTCSGDTITASVTGSGGVSGTVNTSSSFHNTATKCGIWNYYDTGSEWFDAAFDDFSASLVNPAVDAIDTVYWHTSGSPQGSNLGSFDYISTSPTVYTFGSATDLSVWGALPTVALINNSAFGIQFGVDNTGSAVGTTVYVDYVRICIYYSDAGHGGVTLGSLVISGAGTMTAPVYAATGAVTLGHVTIAGSGTMTAPVYSGTGSFVLGAITIAGSGTSTFLGHGAMTLGAISIAGTGILYHVGHGAMTLGAVTIAGTGAYTAPVSTFTGTGAMTLGAVTIAGSGKQPFYGTGAMTLGAITIAGTGAYHPAFNDFHANVKTIATSNNSISGSPGTINGYTINNDNNDRYLLAANTTTTENGIWLYGMSNQHRSTDADGSGELSVGSYVTATAGTLAGRTYVLTASNQSPIVPATSTQTWAEYTSLTDSHTAVRIVLTANTALTTTGSSQDGVTLANNDRVLLTGQTDKTKNGIYYYNSGMDNLTRATDADGTGELTIGSYCTCSAGTHSGQTWRLSGSSAAIPIIIGTDSQWWLQA